MFYLYPRSENRESAARICRGSLMEEKGEDAMQIILYNNESPQNKIQKSITQIASMVGVLRGEADVVNPTIRVYSENLPLFNYAMIPEFSRYYYLRNVRAVRENIFDISLQSDPLMSFDLSEVTGVVVESQNGGSNYLPNRNWVRLVKSKTDILNFSNGLLESGEYILITAGG